MKILITGFEAFLGETINPSQMLVQSIQQNKSTWQLELSSVQIDCLLLPVGFDLAFAKLKAHLATNNYDSILMFGQAGGRSKISIERIAINWKESKNPDNENQTFWPGQEIISNNTPAYFSGLPINQIIQNLETAQIPCEISYSAGAYVCNDLFYQLSDFLKNQKTTCGFIHVPYLPEQVTDKPNTACMSFETMQNALKVILKTLLM